MKILIVEDVLLTAMTLRNILIKNNYAVTAIARNRAEAVKSVIANPPDLALIDIVLEGSEVNGVAIAEELCQLREMPVIFLTANSEPGQFRAAQSVRPAAYLLKPFNPVELLFNVELAYHNAQLSVYPNQTVSNIMLPAKGGLEMISLDQVVYLEADGSYTEIIMTTGQKHLVSAGLRHLESYFTKPTFFRLSRSYIINLNLIQRLKDNELVMSDGKSTLPVPEANKKELLKKLTIVRTKPSGH